MRVAQHTCYLDGLLEDSLYSCLAIDSVARQNLCHHLSGNAEETEQFVIPVHCMDIEKHRT